MNIYIAPDRELNRRLYAEVIQFLRSFPGTIKFVPTEEIVPGPEDDAEAETGADIPTGPIQPVAQWSELFEACAKVRTECNAENNDFVVYLTERQNELNWFSAFDDANLKNSFIQCSDWNEIINVNPVFPVAYEIAVSPFRHMIIGSYDNIKNATHENPIGCINDMCMQKKDVLLNLRTGDICTECMNRLVSLGVLHGDIEQILNILEGIRKQVLFINNFRRNILPGRLIIDRYYQVVLPDYGNMIIELTPLEKTVYLFYLRHPEGCNYSDLIDHRNEIRSIYGRVCNLGEPAVIEANINRLLNVIDGSLNQKVSKIKKKFTDALGENLAQHYIIKSSNGIHKIQLNPEQIIINTE